MNLFAIRHKPSGLFLPRPAGNRGRGGSHVKPSTAPPRFFHSENAAKVALTYWLMGEFHATHYYDHDGIYEESIDIKPDPSRKREEMEIVKFNLTEAS